MSVDGPADDMPLIDPALDVGWMTEVSVVLIPHPKLPPEQRRVVMRDYGMHDGRLTLPCRKAMLFYTLRHLNLDELEITDNPARQHVVIQNRDEVARWVAEDRQGNASTDSKNPNSF
jgi:hypothetical protein